jgi:hypothetical protein
MVKNTGGNKSKKVARKNVSHTSTQDVRKAVDASEMYAVVSKIYSSQRCSVIGADGNTYQCTIRGKFLKNKRSGDGLVNGAWILIGFYEWEVRSDGSKKCDLLEIYSNMEKDKLKQLEARHLAELMKLEGSDGANCTFSSFHVEKEGAAQGTEAVGEESSDEEAEEEPSTPVVVNARTIVYRDTPQEVMDCLNISVDDI